MKPKEQSLEDPPQQATIWNSSASLCRSVRLQLLVCAEHGQAPVKRDRRRDKSSASCQEWPTGPLTSCFYSCVHTKKQKKKTKCVYPPMTLHTLPSTCAPRPMLCAYLTWPDAQRHTALSKKRVHRAQTSPYLCLFCFFLSQPPERLLPCGGRGIFCSLYKVQ